MRKLCLLVVSSLVLLGTFGLQAQVALGEEEPDCSGQPEGVQGFHFGTDPKTGGSIASVYGGAALCGSNIDWLGNLTKGYKEGYILTPGQTDTPNAGPIMRCANPNGKAGHTDYCSGTDLEQGSYAGSSGVDLIECWPNETWACSFDKDAFSTNKVDSNGGYQNNHCADRVTIIGCYESKDSLGLGHGDITVETCAGNAACKNAGYDPETVKYVMHIYQIEPILGYAYYTEIGEPDYNHGPPEPNARDYQQCKYAGAPGSSACGNDPARWLQKNPPTGVYKCSGTPSLLEGAGVRAYAFGMSKPYFQACYSVTWT